LIIPIPRKSSKNEGRWLRRYLKSAFLCSRKTGFGGCPPHFPTAYCARQRQNMIITKVRSDTCIVIKYLIRKEKSFVEQ
jgi:hypothetical protein